MPSLEAPTVPNSLIDPILPATNPMVCSQHVRISIFFDGTGNNLDADSPDMGHTNVARLFRAHPLDDPLNSVSAIYVPGIGTYFKDVNDFGGGSKYDRVTGMGFGAKGQARLDWAIDRVKEQLVKCDNRSAQAKVLDIKVAVFGFSRGAAQARAFCRDLAALCPGERYKLARSGAVPIEVCFLGIFDTVASVGMPTSANTKLTAAENFASAILPPGAKPLKSRPSIDTDPLGITAFGTAAAQPAQGPADGHADWARDMRIGPLVKHGLHLIATHEFRNSFPLDSALQGASYPPQVEEIALPGAHSDLGGGYEPSEGGKCRALGSLLSMVSLWMMYNAAGKYVPFYPRGLFSDHNKQDFGIDPKGSAGREAVFKAYQAYLAKLPASQGLGKDMLAHTRLYYAWRFRAIARSPRFAQVRERMARARRDKTQRLLDLQESSMQDHARRDGVRPPDLEQAAAQSRRQLAQDEANLREAQDDVGNAARDGDDIRHAEEGFRGQRADLMATVSQSHDEFWRAQVKADQLQNRKYQSRNAGAPWPQANENALLEAKAALPALQDAYLRAKARLDSKADDSALLDHIDEYNAALMEDAAKLDAWSREYPQRKLRPHYQAQLDAWRNEFELGRGLRDPAVIELFDCYVHDSLAGFHLDGTRPSDPRVIYVGGDLRMDYAVNTGAQETATSLG